MEIVSYIALTLYLITLMCILSFGLMQFQLLYFYKKRFKHQPQKQKLDGTPVVTIQLPIYNEYFVVDRLLKSITSLNYPREQLQIQVLDDSTDETRQLTDELVSRYKSEGYWIDVIRRENRLGFKAGALQHGLKLAEGEFVAIFDADFVPNPDFLEETLPYFIDPQVGVVQSRWEHLNANHSLITQIQALQLNVHFSVEQKGRNAADLFVQFNGTAGIWRKSTIDDAGGWKADTLTEDLDLSYRAQLKGWKIVFLDEVSAPAELPIEMSSYKSQQFRWMKGGAETAKKLLPVIWKSSLSPFKKIHATMHLMGSSVFLFVFAMGILSLPAYMSIGTLDISKNLFFPFILSTIALFSIYFVANVQNQFNRTEESLLRRIFKFLVLFPLFLSLSMGLSLHNTFAVIQGWLGRKSDFVRTPKFNNLSSQTLSEKSYIDFSFDPKIILEGLLVIYFGWAIWRGYITANYDLVALQFLLFCGYLWVFYLTIKPKIKQAFQT